MDLGRLSNGTPRRLMDLGRRTTKRGSAWTNRHPSKIGVDPYIYGERSIDLRHQIIRSHIALSIRSNCAFTNSA